MHKWEDNIRIGLSVKRCGLDSSGLGQGPVAGTCEHDNEPSAQYKARNVMTS
jgi:hypothetical protein